MDETRILTKRRSTFMLKEAQELCEEREINFSELYRKNATSVFYYLYSRLHNIADAEDLTSETFITALENLHKLRDPIKFTPWVFTIARHKAIDFFRKKQRCPISDYNEELDRTNVVTGKFSQLDQDRLRDLEDLISHLSLLEQEYLRLRIVADLTFAQIASILDEPETRIKKKYYRLLERLKAQVEK